MRAISRSRFPAPPAASLASACGRRPCAPSRGPTASMPCRSALKWLPGNGGVKVADIAAGLGVPAAPVRRALELLERQRLRARTHGGAVAQGVFYELPLRYKRGRHKEEKLRIAREAATRVAAGHAVGLTGGTTTTEAARALRDHQRLTLVTNALNIASEMAVRPHLKLVVTGGGARSQAYALVRP